MSTATESQSGPDVPVADPGIVAPARSGSPLPAGRPVAVVTGASSGIGQKTAEGLARAGYHLVLIARTQERGEATAAALRDAVRNASCEVQAADLSLLHQTRDAADAIAAAHPRIKLLVNNAGIFTARHTVTGEGREAVLATNHLAPYLLQDMLQDRLTAASPSRIINTGSSMSDKTDINPDDLELTRSWSYVRAYARSKLALLMCSNERAARLRDFGVTVNTVHPGAVATSLIRERGAIGIAWRLMRPFLLTEEQGAATLLHVALSREFAEMTGKYVKKSRAVAPNRRALDTALCARVEAETRRLIAETLGVTSGV